MTVIGERLYLNRRQNGGQRIDDQADREPSSHAASRAEAEDEILGGR